AGLAVAARPNDEVRRRRGAPVGSIALSRERTLDGFVFRTGRGRDEASRRSAGMIVAAFFGRTQQERLERRLRRRLEPAPRARDVEKPRRILTLPRLAVVLGRQAGIGE